MQNREKNLKVLELLKQRLSEDEIAKVMGLELREVRDLIDRLSDK